jgi:DUF4097 and DUF4098 domain-containing protein YvlB
VFVVVIKHVKEKVMKRVIVALLILGGSIILVGVNFGRFMKANGRAREKVEERINRSFEVEAGGLLSVDVDGGSIDVKPSDSSKVYVEMYRRIEAGSADEARSLLERHPVRFTQNGNSIYIESDGPNGRYRKNMELHISVPHTFNVDLKTSGGNIGVDGLQGIVKTSSSGGNLRFTNIEGPVRGSTSGGSINVKDVEGEAVVKTSGGSINISNVRDNVVAHTSGGSITANRIGGKLEAKTAGGSLNFEDIAGEIEGQSSGGSVTARFLKPIEASCRLETSGGSVNLFLPENSQFDLDAEASSGHVVTEFPIAITLQGKLDGSSLRGRINGGGPVVYCRTSGSNINLKKTPPPVGSLLHFVEKQASTN